MPNPDVDENGLAAHRVRRLVEADIAYPDSVLAAYYEVVSDVIGRVRDAGSVGKLDIVALTT